MELLVNDLSIDGQFPDILTFNQAITQIMTMRSLAKRYGRELYCHRNIVSSQVTSTLSMQQVIQSFEFNKRRSIMQWLTQYGPFWEDKRTHTDDDYLVHNDNIVTETALGEAAICNMRSISQHLVSLMPSVWGFSPISVTFVQDGHHEQISYVPNYWDSTALELVLKSTPESIISWQHLAAVSAERYTNLFFADNCFESLIGHPFSDGAAKQIVSKLEVLHDLKNCLDSSGRWTGDGASLYQKHFTGEKAWFSDSSDGEKIDFKSEMTFRHPKNASQQLFCPWHGKVKTPQIRIHFPWPPLFNEPLYVVYVGPKITKR